MPKVHEHAHACTYARTHARIHAHTRAHGQVATLSEITNTPKPAVVALTKQPAVARNGAQANPIVIDD